MFRKGYNSYWEFSMKIKVKKMKVMCIGQKGNNKLKMLMDNKWKKRANLDI